MKGKRKTETLVLAALSGLVYTCLRLIMHELIRAAGYHDGGLLSYDSYYQFAFAKELIRTGNFLLFRNPFGSFDNAPHLIDLYASLLKICNPLYRNDLFLFDCVLGTVLVFLTSLYLMRLLSPLGIVDKLILLFGGGVAFIGVFLGFVPVADAVWPGFWGLTYLLNQISTREIVYHFFFFYGLFCLIRRYDLRVIFVIAVLTFLHPFTSITFNVCVVSAWLYQWFRTGKIINCRVRLLVYAIASVGLTVLIFQLYLPSVSGDAKFFKMVYERTNFRIDIVYYGMFLAVPVAYCLTSLFLTKKSGKSKDGEMLWIALVTTGFCVVMNMSYLFTNKIVQPAHWSRVYPYVLLVSVGGLYSLKGEGTKTWRISKLIKISLFVIAISDSILGVKYMSWALFHEKRAPLFLTLDQARVIRKAKDLPPGKFLYLRDGSDKRPVGDFEYAMMSMSLLKGFLGHDSFSPFLEELKPLMYPAPTKSELSVRLLNSSQYIVFDKKLFDRLKLRGWDILYEGDELVFVRKDTKGKGLPNKNILVVHPGSNEH